MLKILTFCSRSYCENTRYISLWASKVPMYRMITAFILKFRNEVFLPWAQHSSSLNSIKTPFHKNKAMAISFQIASRGLHWPYQNQLSVHQTVSDLRRPIHSIKHTRSHQIEGHWFPKFNHFRSSLKCSRTTPKFKQYRSSLQCPRTTLTSSPPPSGDAPR